MNEKSLDRFAVESLSGIDSDKDTWIYTYGSAKLQQARSFDYECDEQYLKERLQAEYPGFKINHASAVKKLDCPPIYAIQESLKWNNAYIAQHSSKGEVIVIDYYLGKYQIIKKTYKLWYLSCLNSYASDAAFNSMLLCIFISFMLCIILWR
ncbi:hypothetical protein [Chamaesiphon sp. GL140_3_metabinner_50]|uniref:hypothetical protein n=1 Tax=Chamaesiphon sp. GL140_3_metabinner_50 TaxID=2970812 RepID=UPI0025DFDBF8|nr:hypothetical protein [Chamaesiphon sp. GL140_3_metabinner_50]